MTSDTSTPPAKLERKKTRKRWTDLRRDYIRGATKAKAKGCGVSDSTVRWPTEKEKSRTVLRMR